MARATAVYTDLDVASDVHRAASQSKAEVHLQLHLHAALQRSADLEVQLETLRLLLEEYQQSILYWKLMCALVIVIVNSTFVLAVLSMSHILVAYSLMMAKKALWSAAAISAVGLVVAVAAVLLCHTGSATACGLVHVMVAAARASLAMARLALRMLSCFVGAMGPWGIGAASAFAVGLMQTIRVLLRRLLSTTRGEIDLACRDLDTARRERDAAHMKADDATRRLAHAESLLQIEINRGVVGAQTTTAEIRDLEDEWCIVANGGISPVEEIHSLEGLNRGDEDDDDMQLGGRQPNAPTCRTTEG
jgi:hypothetical protein